MKNFCIFLALLITIHTVAFPQRTPEQPTADVIYYHGKIITMWDAHPVVEAVAIRTNRFLSVGSDEEVLKTAGPNTRKIDLKGACVVPGLLDSHTHPITAALSEQNETLPPMNSIPEIQAYLRQRLALVPSDRLILVPKIFAPRLKERRYPTRVELDAVASDRPIMVDNGYASVLNSFLLKKLGINRDTPQPTNGKIGKDEKGEPTGVILGAPQLLRELRRDQPATAADLESALKKMQQSYNRVGITSTIDRGQRASGVSHISKSASEGRNDGSQFCHLSAERAGHTRAGARRD